MKYNIPESLAPYLEYIPESMLEGIITDALKEKIFDEGVDVSQQFDTHQLLEQIRELLENQGVSKPTANPVKSKPKEEIQAVIMSTGDETVPDDLKDLVSGFAMSIFK